MRLPFPSSSTLCSASSNLMIIGISSDPNEEEMNIHWDTAFRSLNHPVVDDISSEQLHRFAKKGLRPSVPGHISLQAFLALLHRLLSLHRL
ncbi:hypothetical protein BDR06DRAFT_948499 [Suillus hirtellus]|nr:hypothetical protein BDR06DRAFT_948499 [Suillus hirtellus]